MRAIDFDAFDAALKHAGSLAEPVREQFIAFVAQEADLRGPFGDVLDAVAGRLGASRGKGQGAAMGEGLGTLPEDNTAWRKRFTATVAELGPAITDEALIRFGYAEGAPLSADGRTIAHGPPPSAADRARILGAPDGAAEGDATALSLDEAKAAIGKFSYEAIQAITEEMRSHGLFLRYANRVVALLADKGYHLNDEHAWTQDASEEPRDAAERLTTLALSDTDEGGTLQRQTSKLLGREARMACTLEALYEAGYHLDSAEGLHKP